MFSLDHITAYQSWVLLFIGYGVVVLMWIKGADPFTNVIWHVTWMIIKIPITLAVRFVFFAVVFL